MTKGLKKIAEIRGSEMGIDDKGSNK